MGIIWIASYPKSGNTWVRFLLANYLSGPVESSQQVESLIPGFARGVDMTAYLAAHPTAYGKTHYPWNTSHPYADRTDRAIVIIRNPKDVLLSNLNYQRVIHGHDRGFSDAAYARAFIANGGDLAWFDEGIGTLEDHCQSWLDSPMTMPRLVIRYEDLKADPRRELRSIVSFLGLEADPARINAAVSRSTFDQMRAMEVREKAEKRNGIVFPGAAPRRGWTRYFMNAGKTGSKLASIHPELDTSFDSRFRDLISRLGYSSANT